MEHISEAVTADNEVGIFGSRVRTDLLQFFVMNRRARVYCRRLERELGWSRKPLWTELRRLERIGFLRREQEGVQVYFSIACSDRTLDAFAEILRLEACGD